jgi:acetoacetate decarboxylase
MSYEFLPGRMYRMPTHFGPAPGPRQTEDGRPWGVDPSSHEATSAWITFLTKPELVEALLPPRFELAGDPVVTVTASYVKNMNWLAGRGYNTLGVNLPCRFAGDVDRLTGSLLAVLWENMCDPIITGREELGFPKVYCELPEMTFDPVGGTACGEASWYGFRFYDFELTDLIEDSGPPPQGKPEFMYKYMPRTGEWGTPDVCYATTVSVQPGFQKVLRRWTGKGKMQFHQARWKDLPTLVHIVNALARLDVLDWVGAGVVQTVGADDLRGQRILR